MLFRFIAVDILVSVAPRAELTVGWGFSVLRYCLHSLLVFYHYYNYSLSLIINIMTGFITIVVDQATFYYFISCCYLCLLNYSCVVSCVSLCLVSLPFMLVFLTFGCGALMARHLLSVTSLSSDAVTHDVGASLFGQCCLLALELLCQLIVDTASWFLLIPAQWCSG